MKRSWPGVPLDQDLTQAALAANGLPLDGKENSLKRVIMVKRQEGDKLLLLDTISRFSDVRPMFNAMRKYWLRTGAHITIFINEEESANAD